ncbi:hypothetical protein [Aromatoleum sp.]|uniref:hypothetical protein n=1 Tax=Aromatoleum sp. TaxID=2307007 RepID=UPI002FC88959
MIAKVVADAEQWGFTTAIDAEQWGFKTAIDADVANLNKAKADGAKVIAADIASFQAVGGKVRDQYIAKNPLIADFYGQAKDL